MMRSIQRTLQAAVVGCALLAVTPAADVAGELGVIDLEGALTLPNASQITDVWGYVDPTTGKEYALVGHNVLGQGFFIVDVSDPTSPFLFKQFNARPDFEVSSFDIKAWSHYVICVNGRTSGLGHIVDISDLSRPSVVSWFGNSHNVAIDSRGFFYLARAGTIGENKLVDTQLMIDNPGQLGLATLWRDSADKAHDITVDGDRMYDFHGQRGTRIHDISNPGAPVLLGQIQDPAIDYHHSGDATEDGKYLFIMNELSKFPTPDITVWNIADPANPYQVASISEPLASPHNLYVVGDYAYVSFYAAGFHVYDISDPTNPRLADSFDTSVHDSEGFVGAFGVYPFTPSGVVYVSDIDNGLYVFSFTPGTKTAVLITAFDVRVANGLARLTWAIGDADDLEGFYVYRSVAGREGFVRITDRILDAGEPHEFIDRSAEPGRTYWYRIGAVDRDGEFFSQIRTVTIPEHVLSLSQNFPNPFNPMTTIAFTLPSDGYARLAVYDAQGKRVRTLLDGVSAPGPHSVTWDGTDDRGIAVASGNYFYLLETKSAFESKSMLLLK